MAQAQVERPVEEQLLSPEGLRGTETGPTGSTASGRGGDSVVRSIGSGRTAVRVLFRGAGTGHIGSSTASGRGGDIVVVTGSGRTVSASGVGTGTALLFRLFFSGRT